MGTDHRADGVDVNVLYRHGFADAARHILGVLRAVAVADENRLLLGVFDGFFHMANKRLQRLAAAPHLFHGDQVPVVVYVQNGLNIQHGAHHRRGRRHPPAAF